MPWEDYTPDIITLMIRGSWDLTHSRPPPPAHLPTRLLSLAPPPPPAKSCHIRGSKYADVLLVKEVKPLRRARLRVKGGNYI